MLYPEINKLRDAAGSRYYLVSMAAKRARDIIDGSLKLDERITTKKPVSIAAEEIAEGLFSYVTIEEASEETEAVESFDAESMEVFEAEYSEEISDAEAEALEEKEEFEEAEEFEEVEEFEASEEPEEYEGTDEVIVAEE